MVAIRKVNAFHLWLKQINADNVHKLKEAWVFRTGDVKQPNDPGEITNEVTPIKVGDTLYLCTAHQRLFALDAASGEEKWHYDPELKTNESFQHVTCRGVSYHEAKAETASIMKPKQKLLRRK